MAPFDLTLVGKNIQTFRGNFKFLEEFLTQIEILHDLTDEQDRELFIKYIYNFKLTTQVRSTIGRSNRPTTLIELKKILEDSYPNPRTLQQVLTELGTIRQNTNTIAEFREGVTELANQLSNFEIAKLTNPTQEMKDVVYNLNDSVALNAFLRGVKHEFQQILLSNPPKTLNEAVERCMTAEKSFQSENNNIYHLNRNNNNYKNNNRYNNSYIENNQGNNNVRNNNYGSARYNNNNNYRNNTNYRNNSYNNDGYRSNRNNFSNRTNVDSRNNNRTNFSRNENTQNNNFNQQNNRYRNAAPRTNRNNQGNL